VILGVFAAGIVVGNGAAGAAPADCAEKGCVRALQVAGLVDPVEADFVTRAVADANNTPGVVAIVLEVDSAGVVLSDADFERLARTLKDSPIPVTAWVGTGAEATHGAAELFLALPGSTMAPGGKLGAMGAQRLSTQHFGDLLANRRAELAGRIVDADAAKSLGAIDRVALTAGDHLLDLPNVKSEQVTDKKGQPRRQLVSIPTAAKLDIWARIMHTAASPPVTYLLLSVGVGLLIFEFFTAGIGIAGVVGAGSLLLGGYGLGVLPVRPWAVVLLAVAGLAFAIDVQAGVPRFWTAVGVVTWIVGSLWLFAGVATPWIALVVGILGMLAGMVAGMPSMIRSRFGTPTIGRDWMIDTQVTVTTALDPDGIVEVAGAQWRARTNRATPLAVGAVGRVASIDGLTLEIEPLDGAARDYRERRG
jgi:membrane-bound serine protease (ClpP class)